MARRSARVVLNRKAVDNVELAIADGANAVAQTIVMNAKPSDAPPYGVGLTDRGGWLTFVRGKKIAGGGRDGRQPKRPRAAKVTEAIVAIAGFGFPARFHELGTTDTGANPFLHRSREETIPHIPKIMRKNAAYRIARLR